jgi:hypothetical protein
MIPYPDVNTRDAVVLYDLMCSVAAKASFMNDDVLRTVGHWIILKSGAEDFEMQALMGLINGNLDV